MPAKTTEYNVQVQRMIATGATLDSTEDSIWIDLGNFEAADSDTALDMASKRHREMLNRWNETAEDEDEAQEPVMVAVATRYRQPKQRAKQLIEVFKWTAVEDVAEAETGQMEAA